MYVLRITLGGYYNKDDNTIHGIIALVNQTYPTALHDVQGEFERAVKRTNSEKDGKHIINFLKKYDVRNIITGKPMASYLEKPATAYMKWSFYTQGSNVGSAIIPVTEITTAFDSQKGFINKINKEERTYEN